MTLADKLKFKASLQLMLFNAGKDETSLFNGLEIKSGVRSKTPMSQVLLFARHKKELETSYTVIISKLTADAVFWIAYPKKTSGIESDLSRDEGWSIVMNSDFRIVSSASINDIWTAVRISRKKPDAAYKSSVPMAERKTEGIDYIKRVVKLPADASVVLKRYKDLETFFYSLAFTHQKEHMEAIADAKKPETRQKRIEKMAEMLLAMKSDKENKKKK